MIKHGQALYVYEWMTDIQIYDVIEVKKAWYGDP